MNIKIDDLIIENFQNSRDALLEFFGIGADEFVELGPYVKVLAALRALPRPAIDDVAIPTLSRLFAEMGIDPKTDRGREAGAAFADIFALSIQDATNMIMQNMEQHGRAAAALRAGKAGLLA